MKRQLPGLSEAAGDSRAAIPEGVFLVRVDGAQYRWHAQKPFYELRLSILEPKEFAERPIVGCLFARLKRCGSWAGSCGTSSTIPSC